MDTKNHIRIFITKNLKFRAVIKEPEQPIYEVTINGKSWKEGKSAKHANVIKLKIKQALTRLNLQGELL